MDDLPITEEWLTSIGFKPVESDMGPSYADHFERRGINVWEFNDTGVWLWLGHDSVEMRTQKHLLSLVAWIEFDAANRP